MSDEATVSCPACGTQMTGAARFCPGCGKPRTWLQSFLEEESRRSGVPYLTLLETARQQVAAGALADQVALLRADVQRLNARLARLEGTPEPLFVAQPVATPITPPIAPAPQPVMPVAPEPSVANVFDTVTSEVPQRTGWSVEPVTPDEPPLYGPPAPPPSPTPTPPPAPAPQPFDLEQLLSGSVLAWVGGLALLVGSVFFLSLAFSRGWIGPEARVMIGLGAGLAAVLGGGFFFERRERLFGHVLVAVGLGVLSMSFLAGTRLYDFIPLPLALLGTLASALLAAAIAVRSNSQVVAAYGLVAALIAPPLLGASPNGATVAFLSVVLVGTTAIALLRTWTWLPPVAFLLSVPQVMLFVVDEERTGPVLLAAVAFWLLNALAAGGEEYRDPRGRLSPSSTTLLVANAAFIVWAGFVALDGDLEGYRGLFLTLVAAAHGAIGLWFLRGRGDLNPFGLLAAGTGLAAFSMAVPIQLGGAPVPIAWTAEAVALAWVAARRQHRYSAGAAGVLGSLALFHLFAFEYPVDQLASDLDQDWPFLHAAGGTLAFMLGALAVAAWLVPQRLVRVGLASLGIILLAYALPFELSGISLVAAWSALYMLAVALNQWPVLSNIDAYAPDDPRRQIPFIGREPAMPATLVALLATGHMLQFELPLDALNGLTRPDVPFTDGRTLTIAILAGATLIAGFISRNAMFRAISVAAAVLFAAYLVPFELSGAAIVVAWAGLALLLGVLADRFPGSAREQVWLPIAGMLLAAGVLRTVGVVAPPSRMFVDAASTVDHPLLWSGASLALGALAGVLAYGYYRLRARSHAGWLAGVSAVLAIYLLSVGVVDEFQRRVGGTRALEELEKQAQVGLSILWAVLGVSAFIAGIVRFGPKMRLFSLALLGVATIKVFVFDLASLDAAYRVLSFIGLGILLLGSSYAYQRLTPRRFERVTGDG